MSKQDYERTGKSKAEVGRVCCCFFVVVFFSFSALSCIFPTFTETVHCKTILFGGYLILTILAVKAERVKI